MKTVRANSLEQELEWALSELRRCEENRVDAILAKEAAEERVSRARLALYLKAKDRLAYLETLGPLKHYEEADRLTALEVVRRFEKKSGI